MNPRLDAIVAAIRRHLPLGGSAGHDHSFWFLKCHPKGKGTQVKLAEYRAKGGALSGPFSTHSFYARDAEAVEKKLAERGLA